MPRTNQLVIHEDNDMADQLSAAIERALGSEADVIHVRNFKTASTRIADERLAWSLIVVSARAPGAAHLRPGNDSTAADAFIRTTHRDQSGVPIIALSVNDDPKLEGLIGGLDDTALVSCKPDFLREFETMARDFHLKRPVRPTLLELEIRLLDGESGAWRVRRKGRVQSAKEGTFAIDSKAFSRLVNFSTYIPNAGDTWSATMDLACEQVEQLLFEGYDNDLSTTFFSQRAEVGGTENIRVRFTMAPSRQIAMVEALRDRMGTRDFWMLKAPIVRQYTIAGNNRPLFSDNASRRGKANCLVVNANPAPAEFLLAGSRVRCLPLPEIRAEASGVLATLQKASREQQGIGKVEPLDLSRGDADPVGKLLNVLERETWDLVHFAGHSLISEAGEPNLVLDPEIGAVLDFERLVKHLQRNRFLFVSSCKSSNPSFITKAIDSVIPAVLGYRWPITDQQASTFACSFYQSLFTLGKPAFQSIDYAFLAARCATHRSKPSDNAWASPMLLTQLPHEAVD